MDPFHPHVPKPEGTVPGAEVWSPVCHRPQLFSSLRWVGWSLRFLRLCLRGSVFLLIPYLVETAQGVWEMPASD